MNKVLVGVMKNGSTYDEIINVTTTGVCFVKEMQGNFEIGGLYVDDARPMDYDKAISFFNDDAAHAQPEGVVFTKTGYWAIRGEKASFYEFLSEESSKEVEVVTDIEYESEDNEDADDEEEDYE